MEDSIELTKETWRNLRTSQKAQLLKTLGHSTTFAQTKTMEELVRRGGGFAARDIHKVVKRFRAEHPHTRIIRG